MNERTFDCKVCGDVFVSTSSTRPPSWCSAECAGSVQKNCPDCGLSGPRGEVFFRSSAKGYRYTSRCRSCHGKRLRASKAYKRAKSAYKLRHGHWWISESDRLAIYERDGWKCKLCGKRVGKSYPPNHPRSPVLDHIVPRSIAADDAPSNLQLAHRVCNARKSNGVNGDGEQLMLLSEVA